MFHICVLAIVSAAAVASPLEATSYAYFSGGNAGYEGRSGGYGLRDAGYQGGSGGYLGRSGGYEAILRPEPAQARIVLSAPRAPIASAKEEEYIDYNAPPRYEFKYAVADPKTGDKKEQYETRNGDAVKGEYSLYEPDGTRRIVRYYADKKIGFNAEVRREGKATLRAGPASGGYAGSGGY